MFITGESESQTGNLGHVTVATVTGISAGKSALSVVLVHHHGMGSPFDSNLLHMNLQRGAAADSRGSSGGAGFSEAMGMAAMVAQQQAQHSHLLPSQSAQALQLLQSASQQKTQLNQQELIAFIQRTSPTSQHIANSHYPQLLQAMLAGGGQTSAASAAAPRMPASQQAGLAEHKEQGEAKVASATGKCVPPLVEKLVPEAELYKRLLDMEELLDRASAKQSWEIEDALRDRPSLLRTLRICVCNTHKNQATARVQAPDEQQDARGMGEEGGQPRAASACAGPAEWTLHIFGDVFGVEQDSQKLSDFVERVIYHFYLCSCSQNPCACLRPAAASEQAPFVFCVPFVFSANVK